MIPFYLYPCKHLISLFENSYPNSYEVVLHGFDSFDWQNQLQKKKSDTNECIYKTETDLQILKKNYGFQSGNVGGAGIN